MSTPLKHTSAYWTAQNIVLNENQLGIETDTNLSKLGDGSTAWNALAYHDPATEYTTASGTDTYTASLKMPLIYGYFPGQRLRVKFTNTNTGAATINLNGFGAVAIKKGVSMALSAGDILAGGVYELVYDGTNFQITTPTGNIPTATPTLAQVLAAGNDGGGQTITNTVWNGSVITATYGGTGINNGTSTLTLSGNAAYTLSGGGTISLGGFTLTVPATGTAALGTGASTRVAYWSGTNTLTSSSAFLFNSGRLSIGTSLSGANYTIDSAESANGFTAIRHTNSNAGAAASAWLNAGNGTNTVWLGIYGTGHTGSGFAGANYGNIQYSGTAGMAIYNYNASGAPIIFAPKLSTEAARFLSSAELVIGATTLLQSFGKLEVQHNSNSYTQVLCSNVNAGASVGNGFNAANGTANFYYGVYGTGRTTSGLIVANRGYFYSDNSAGINIGCSAAGDLRFFTGGLAATNQRMKITSLASVVIGNNSAALATNATDGFLYIPTCAGTPTGVPTAQTGTVAMVFDSSNNKLYIYDGGWLGGTTPGAFT